ncbi:MAG: hypothetical protein ACE5GE_15885, partial [Phycisphaerae bacterium]
MPSTCPSTQFAFIRLIALLCWAYASAPSASAQDSAKPDPSARAAGWGGLLYISGHEAYDDVTS